MNTTLKAFAAAVTLLLITPIATADGYRSYDRAYRDRMILAEHRRDHAYRHGYNPYYYRHYHHNHNRRRSDNDDWAWAVGGLVLGAIIADSANSNAQQNPPQNSQPLPPPQRRKVVTCYDEVAYDQDNKPYVARQCYETMQ